VIDRTGIQGYYQFEMAFAPETTDNLPPNFGSASDSTDPVASVYDAVRQYGLALKSAKTGLEVLTVTHAEKLPIEN